MSARRDGEQAAAAVRLDVWLDIACLYRTRSEAQKALKNGRVAVNGQPAKAGRLVRAGDELVIHRPFGRRQTVTIRTVAERHMAKGDARQLYEDRTPAPSAEEIEMRRLERIYRAAVTPPTTPDRRARRAIRKLKEGEEE